MTRSPLSTCGRERQQAPFRPLLLALFLAVPLAGCVSAKYTYGNRAFSTPDKALAHQAMELSAILDAIHPAGAPPLGSALVVLPSREELRQHYIRTSGFGANTLRPEHFQFLISIMENEQDTLTKALQKRGLFDKLSVGRANNPAAAPIAEHDFLVFRDIDGWFIRNQTSGPTKIALNPDGALGLARTEFFLQAAEERARSLTLK